MTVELNAPEAQGAIRATRERLMTCGRFRGSIKDGQGKEISTIDYESSGAIEIHNINFYDLVIDVRAEDGKIFIRETLDSQWQEIDSSEEKMLMQCWTLIWDPRKILANLEDAHVCPVGKDQKTIRAFLNIRGLGVSEDLITVMEKGLKKIPLPFIDVNTYSRLQRPGSSRPPVEFYIIDQESHPLRMTVGRIFPGEEDSFTVEFEFKYSN